MIRRPPRSTRLTLSFPTRRSSDLPAPEPAHLSLYAVDLQGQRRDAIAPRRWKGDDLAVGHDSTPPVPRSEEHTSELQSLMRISYAVFCLKKKNKLTKLILTPYTNTLH